jgi:hypothetical protein
VQQDLDPDIWILGNKEWQNHLILGGCLATGTQNGKIGSGGTPTGDDGTRKNPSLPLLETINISQQMDNLETRDQTVATFKEVEELGRRKIAVTDREDQLIWGHKEGREFNLKEVRHYIVNQDQEDSMHQWDKLWNNPHWPKIKIFQWLILHNRILTWENLMKRCFIGPSRCHLCEEKEEITNHILDECPYTAEFWDWEAGIFRQSNRIKSNISATINTWKENYSENEEVNLCWTLIPGMVIWAIWKEWNRRIFRNQIWTARKIKETIIAMTREMVQRYNYQIGGSQLTDRDLKILEAFQLKEGRNPSHLRRFP